MYRRLYPRLIDEQKLIDSERGRRPGNLNDGNE